MLDTPAETRPDRRPEMLVCVCDPADPLSLLLDDADPAVWGPAGPRVQALGRDDAASLAGVIAGRLRDADVRAVLLVGRTRRSDGFRLQMRAENRALTGGRKVSLTGPATARTTAPVAEMVRALADAGFSADATSDSEEDAGSYLLYRVLTALPDNADAVAVGLLRAPQTLDADRVKEGVRAAASAMARHLSPPRSRLS